MAIPLFASRMRPDARGADGISDLANGIPKARLWYEFSSLTADALSLVSETKHKSIEEAGLDAALIVQQFSQRINDARKRKEQGMDLYVIGHHAFRFVSDCIKMGVCGTGVDARTASEFADVAFEGFGSSHVWQLCKAGRMADAWEQFYLLEGVRNLAIETGRTDTTRELTLTLIELGEARLKKLVEMKRPKTVEEMEGGRESFTIRQARADIERIRREASEAAGQG